MAFFSVIIPVYNAQSFLKESIGSVLNQSISDWELIIVNDGSTDQSLELINDLTKELDRVHVIQQDNKGLGAARNCAAQNAKGEWLAFLDADDYWASNKLAALKECIAINPEAEVIYHPVMEMKPSGLMRKRQFWETRTKEELILKGNPLVPSATAIKRAVFENFGGFIEDRDQVEDLLLWFRMYNANTKFHVYRKALTVYRIGTGVTSKLEDHLNKVFKSMQDAVDDGIFDDQVIDVFKKRKFYEAARQLHKLGQFEEAIDYYNHSNQTGFKFSLLLWSCKMGVVV